MSAMANNLGYVFLQVLNNAEPDQIAMICKMSNTSITYNDLLENSLKVARKMRDIGIESGDVVGIVSENRMEYMVAIMACFYLQAPIHPLNQSYLKVELQQSFDKSKPKVVFTSKENFDKVFMLQQDTNYIIYIVNFDTDYLNIVNYGLAMNQIDVSSGINVDRAMIMNSSGTTGYPQSVVLTQNNINAAMKYLRGPYILNKEKSKLIFLPLCHIAGFVFAIGALQQYSKILLMSKFKPDLYCEIIQEYSIEAIEIVPTIASFLAHNPIIDEYNLTSIKYIMCGGAPLPQDIQNDIKKRFNCPVTQLYGMTETCGLIIAIPIGEELRVGSVGKPIPNVEIKVVDPLTKEILSCGKKGEICVKSSLNMKEYLGNIKATLAAFDEEGFFRTGDIGYFDEDGYFFINDRLKDVIKYKGYQVLPVELEDMLIMHEDILDAAVIGVAHERAGEVPMALVVKRQNSKLNEEDVKSYIADRVSIYKQLYGGVKFVESIPRSETGKILRRLLRKAFLQNIL